MRPFLLAHLIYGRMPGLDRIAIFLSGLCLVHCLALPVAVLLTPFLSDWLIESETAAHWVLFGTALPISALALGRGYLHHHDTITVIIGVVGLALMLVGVTQVFGEANEAVVTISGVLLLLWAHLRNLARRPTHQH